MSAARRRGPWLVAALLCAPALVVALRTVHGLRWPHDQDLYRDVAQAQALADGRWGDPFYAGESIWYNPLVPALVALGARVSGAEVAWLYTQAGPWLTLAGTIAFAVLARRLLDPWSAAAAVVHYVLLRDPDVPGWTGASLTPWAFASSAAHGLGFLALLAGRAAWLRPAPWRGAAAGALLGLAFLAHTAAALVPVAAAAVALVLRRPSATQLRARLPVAVVAGAVAIVVALPFLASIVGRYGLDVQNPAPQAWSFAPREGLAVHDLVRWLRLGTWALGAWALVRLLRGRRRLDAALVAGLAAGSVGLYALAQGLDALRAAGTAMPAVVPAFHFRAWAEAAGSLLAGHGLRIAASVAVDRRRQPAFLSLVLVVVGLLALPSVPGRMDVVWGRRRALELQERAAWERVRAWLRASSGPRDVVLASPELSLFVVAASGRPVVAVEDVFSNPYVPYGPRSGARDAMWAALRAGDTGAFVALAQAWGVRFVLVSRVERPWVARAPEERLRLAYEAGGLQVYEVAPRP